MMLLKRAWQVMTWLAATSAVGFVSVCAAIYLYLAPTIPPVEVLKHVELQTPLRIFASDGELIAEIGEQRRTPIPFDQIPELYVKALLAIEDHRFEDHFGVDPLRFGSAALEFITTGRPGSGGSTLTQQVARSFFLAPDKTFTRKFSEIILAFEMEQVLSKAEILELYSNQMFLGHRAYGIQAAAQVYYGRDIDQLTLPELAVLAGLHQRPSAANPIASPQRALARRNVVLNRMLQLGFITSTEHQQAINAPNTASRHAARVVVSAPYVAEQVRLELTELVGAGALTEGYRVFTTIDSRQQQAAQQAVINNLVQYTERHGYLGPEQQLELPTEDAGSHEPLYAELAAQLGIFGGLEPAIVIQVDDGESSGNPHVLAYGRRAGWLEIPLSEMTWARTRRAIDNLGPAVQKPSDVLARGDVIRVRQTAAGRWRLTQIPQAQAGFVAMNTEDGSITAMVGGFDFFLSRFNRVTQAERQPGSTFKSFVYAAALEQGYSPSTLVNDAPVTIRDATLEGVWRPRNVGDRYRGLLPMREALYRSINVASVRLLDDIGMSAAINTVTRLGFPEPQLERNLGMVLGNSVFTPLAVNRGYAAFANGGFLVTPYLLDRVEDRHGNIIFESPRAYACSPCDPAITEVAPQVLSPQTHYLMVDMLKDGINRGTATAARSLGRNDIAGKTGTTNNNADAWFSGFSPQLAATAWVGRDDNTSLGFNEFGGRAALPIWIDFMAVALQGIPQRPWPRPTGIVQVRIDPETGLLAPSDYPGAIFELFIPEAVPTRSVLDNGSRERQAETPSDRLF